MKESTSPLVSILIDKDKHTGRISTAPRSGFLLLGKGGIGIFLKLFSMKDDDIIRLKYLSQTNSLDGIDVNVNFFCREEMKNAECRQSTTQ
jgi:hypothetical protein